MNIMLTLLCHWTVKKDLKTLHYLCSYLLLQSMSSHGLLFFFGWSLLHLRQAIPVAFPNVLPKNQSLKVRPCNLEDWKVDEQPVVNFLDENCVLYHCNVPNINPSIVLNSDKKCSDEYNVNVFMPLNC